MREEDSCVVGVVVDAFVKLKVVGSVAELETEVGAEAWPPEDE